MYIIKIMQQFHINSIAESKVTILCDYSDVTDITTTVKMFFPQKQNMNVVFCLLYATQVM